MELSDETQARLAVDRLKADVLSGALPPGGKLRVSELKTRYGLGASPLREALSQVASLGYVTSENRRGYRVAEMSEPDLADITKARQIIETGMLDESMTARRPEWEIGVVTAFEQFKWVVRKSVGDHSLAEDAVDQAHKRLHAAIVAGSSSPRLIAMQALLFDQAARYRALMIAEVHSAEDFLQAHQILVDRVLAHDIDDAKRELSDHLHRTLRDVYCPVCATHVA